MKRDFELIRELLLEAKNAKHYVTEFKKRDPLGVELYHLKMMDEQELISLTSLIMGDRGSQQFSLTWEGHELLDFIGNDSVWRALTEMSKELQMPVSMSMIDLLRQNRSIKIGGASHLMQWPQSLAAEDVWGNERE